jgi:hypothetical protein
MDRLQPFSIVLRAYHSHLGLFLNEDNIMPSRAIKAEIRRHVQLSRSLRDNCIDLIKSLHSEHVRSRKSFEARESGLDVFADSVQ